MHLVQYLDELDVLKGSCWYTDYRSMIREAYMIIKVIPTHYQFRARPKGENKYYVGRREHIQDRSIDDPMFPELYAEYFNLKG